MATYSVWITLLTPLYGERIIGKLVNKGYKVTAMDGGLFGSPKEQEDTPSYLMAISIFSMETLKQIHFDVSQALKVEKVKFFSFIVCKDSVYKDSGAMFSGSNISLKSLQKQQPKRKKFVKRVKYLSLVQPPVEEKKSNE